MFSKSYISRSIPAIILSLLFLAFCLYEFSRGSALIALISPGLLIILILAISMEHFFILLFFLIPLSVQLRFIIDEPTLDLFLPTEIMLVLLMIIFLYRLISGSGYITKQLYRPISLVIILWISWTLFSVFSSTMVMVSVKALLARLWFLTAFYFMALELLKRKDFLRKVLTAMMLGMAIVVFFNIFNLGQSGFFNQRAAHSTMHPFFNDHTSFGASLALLIPLSVYFLFSSEKSGRRLLYTILLFIFIAGLVFSYSRAAWISVFVAAVFAAVLSLRISLKTVAAAAVIVAIGIGISWSSIIMNMEQSEQKSSGNMYTHLRSVVNITSDDSNVERINRWKCALRMFSEKPVFGWGPGTYQFQYAPYQMAAERSGVSTNFGDMGNAHSEYLSNLVESGIPAMLLFIAILIMAFRKGLMIWYKSDDLSVKYLSMALMTALLSYAFHGGLNNFLDTDKIAGPFWIYIASLTTMKTGSGTPSS